MTRVFFSSDRTRYVLFTADALAYMYANAQCNQRDLEAGGEVFAIDPDAAGLVITSACGPNPGDRRSRNAWIPDIAAADRDRQREFSLGRHSVGLWHTHPEAYPSPSGRDQRTTNDYLAAFHGERIKYLLVIIGNRGNPLHMTVWIADCEARNNWSKLVETTFDTPL